MSEAVRTPRVHTPEYRVTSPSSVGPCTHTYTIESHIAMRSRACGMQCATLEMRLERYGGSPRTHTLIDAASGSGYCVSDCNGTAGTTAAVSPSDEVRVMMTTK